MCGYFFFVADKLPSRFYLASGELDFTMDPITGMLRIRVPLDRELRDSYILSVAIRNGISVGYCQVSLFLFFVFALETTIFGNC